MVLPTDELPEVKTTDFRKSSLEMVLVLLLSPINFLMYLPGGPIGLVT